MNLSENVVQPHSRDPLLLVECRSNVKKSSNVRIFIISRSREGLTFFDKNNHVNIFGEKSNMIMIKM